MIEAQYPEGRTLGGVLVETITLAGCPLCGEREIAIAPDLERFACPRCGQDGDALDVVAYLDQAVLFAILGQLKFRCETIARLRETAASPESELDLSAEVPTGCRRRPKRRDSRRGAP